MFKLKYHAEFSSKFEEIAWRIEIAERGYSGTPSPMALVMDSPLTITWEQKGDDFFVPIKGSECRINIRCFKNFQYLELFTSNPRQFRVSVYRQQKLYWRGYLVSDLYEEPLEPAPHEISIKAIDGFNILSGIDYIHKEGLTSLKTMIDECLAIMELDIPLIDWVMLQPLPLDENSLMWENVYVDANRFRHMHREATYRDVLEFCLKPFLAQILQSNGEIHIRRVMSLYSKERPPSFFEDHTIELATEQGELITTNDGNYIGLSGGRMVLEPIWEDGMNLLSTAMMEIVPALRSVTVEVENPNSTNIADIVGIMEQDKWSNNSRLYFNESLNHIRVATYQEVIPSTEDHQHVGFAVKGGVTSFEVKFNVKYSLGLWWDRPGAEEGVLFKWGIKLVGKEKTYWWNSTDAIWETEYTVIEEKITDRSGEDCSEHFEEFPESGNLVIFIKAHFNDWYFGVGYFVSEFEVVFSKNDEFDDKQTQEVRVNPANNIEMKIEIPISHIPALTNNNYIYPIYFCDNLGNPIKLWYDGAHNSVNTLAAHAAKSALQLRTTPTKRLSGNIFTNRYLDMNSALVDQQNLMAGFYTNSLEVDALEDESNVELVELPELITKWGEGGAPAKSLYVHNGEIDKVVKCGGGILFYDESNNVYYFDPLTHITRLIEKARESIKGINTSENGASYFTTSKKTSINAFGRIEKQIANSEPENIRAYFKQFNRNYVIVEELRPDGLYLYREGYFLSLDTGGLFDGYATFGKLRRVAIGDYTIATSLEGRRDQASGTLVFDLRYGSYVAEKTKRFWDGDILSISDFWIVSNSTSAHFTEIYRRDEVGLEDVTLVRQLASYPEQTLFADQTPGKVIIAGKDTAQLWSSLDNDLATIPFTTGSLGLIKGVFFINMEAYILLKATPYIIM